MRRGKQLSPKLMRDAQLLSERLGIIRDRWRSSRVIAGATLLIAIFCLVVLLLAGAEALVYFSGSVRWVLLGASLLALGTALAQLILRPMLQPISLERVARMVELRRPEIGNILIGGLQLTRAHCPAPSLAEAALRQAVTCSARLDPAVTVDRARLLRLAKLAAAALALLLLAFAASPTRMSGALKRLIMPGVFVPRTGSVKIVEVRPGNATVLAGSEVAICVRIAPTGDQRHPPARLYYQASGGTEFSRRMESADGRNYTYLIRNLEQEIRYRVEIGDSQTGYYRLRLVPRPAVTRLDFEYRFPAYTGRQPQELLNVANREIRVPVGTQVRLRAHTNRPVKKAYVDLGAGRKQDMTCSSLGLRAGFRVEKSGSYSIIIEGPDGHRNLNPPRYPIIALPDAPPVVRITAPGRDLEIPVDGGLPLAIRASDDYGISKLRLLFRRNRGGELQELAAWNSFISPRSVQQATRWKLSARDFDPGDIVYYHAEATDRGQTGKSPTFQVKLIDPREAKARKLKDLTQFMARLRKILEQQRAARAGAVALFAKPIARKQLLAGCKLLACQQGVIRSNTLVAAELAPLDDATARKVRQAVLLLAAGPERVAEKLAENLAASLSAAGSKTDRAQLLRNQDLIIRRLSELLLIIEKLEAQVTKEDDKEASDLPDDVREKLKNLSDKLKEFMEEQKKLLEAWNELAKRPVEDLTAEDKKKMKALIATEDKWEKFLKDAHSDLSKLHKQDFTDPKLLKELIETYVEVETAKGAMTAGSKPVPVPVEQAGLESAEALTTHLEKWLTDTPDRDKWEMEEPLAEGQTPMAELPEQLEDLIGDLMEEQEDIFEEMEDTTSSWTDSLDKGAGWDAMDGPISNMSAQGVTGNRLPNSSEISGRSGEGRTGKAAGEFVEKTATGKGGRKTPTRLTPDQFLKGQIEDKSKDPAGGSTGGGKVGGSGGEGLEGPAPPETKAATGRLAGKQAQILSRAERIRLELKVRNHPTADLDRVIALMKGVHSDIKDGRYRNISRKRNIMLTGLKTTRDFAAASSQVRTEKTRVMPKRLRDQLYDAMDGGVPSGYEELVKKYYESISR
jgi:hypothetical protein